MISVLLLGFEPDGQKAAAVGDAVRTLAALVPAAVDGVVRDLCLAGPAEASGLRHVADHAGCAFVPANSVPQALTRGAGHLRCPNVLVARAGMVIDRAVIEELATLLPTLGEGSPASYVLRADRRDLIGRLFPALAPTAALLCSRAWLLRAAAPSLARLAHRAEGRRVLKTVAWLDV